jgi:hypothetical protein
LPAVISMEGYPETLRISPPDWPSQGHGPRPGDLTQFLPQGFGLGAPMIVMPYGAAPTDSFYGFDQPKAHPILNGPLTEASGGTLYFDDGVSLESLTAAMEVLGIYATPDYVAYASSAGDPVNERYLDQLRIVSSHALGSVFGAGPEPPRQALDAPAAIIGFVAAQRAKWNAAGSSYSAKLSGAAGGDGDWAKESLAFGLHVENTYWGVYRVWSRAWLVTK